MRINDIINHPDNNPLFQSIKTECSDFIRESAGIPVFRVLPSHYNTVQRVKVRQHKRSDGVTEAFNLAFQNEFKNIIPRCVLAKSVVPKIVEGTDLFYVFPINGYRYAYNSVTDTTSSFKTVLEALNGLNNPLEITSDLIRYTYTKVNLCEGLAKGSEIIFYNLPYYYAVRANTTYQHILTLTQ